MLIGHTLADRFGTLLAADPQVCEILQRDHRELVGMGYAALTHPDDCSRNVTAVAQLQIGAGPLVLRKRYLRPDGSVAWCNVQVSRLHGNDGGHLVGTIQMINPASLARGPESLWRAARRMDAVIQHRRHELGEDLCTDYGWMVMLQLYLAEAEGRTATVASIGKAANIHAPLAVHWVDVLERKGLVEQSTCPGMLLQLTAVGLRKVEYLLEGSFHT